MSKERNSKKEGKKPALMTAKEKKAAKRDKKSHDAGNVFAMPQK